MSSQLPVGGYEITNEIKFFRDLIVTQSFFRFLMSLLLFSEEKVESEVDDVNSEIFLLLPNLIIYGAMNVVTIVTIPNIGRTEEEMAPTS